MKTQMIKRAQEMMETGTHVQSACYKIANGMSNEEIREFSDDVGGRALVNGATRIITGKHHLTGADRTPLDVQQDRSAWNVTAASYMETVIEGREWRG